MNVPSPDEEDLLQAAREARAAGEEARERELIAKLLAPYFNWARQIAYAKIAGAEDRAADAEEIAGDLLLRLVGALHRTLEFDSTLHVVAKANLRFAIAEYWRDRREARKARADFEELDRVAAPEVLGEPDMDDAIEPYLVGLSDRDRKLARERLIEDRPPIEMAERNGISRNAVDAATSRLLAKMRKNAPTDVRNRRTGPA